MRSDRLLCRQSCGVPPQPSRAQSRNAKCMERSMARIIGHCLKKHVNHDGEIKELTMLKYLCVCVELAFDFSGELPA
jgi:hypothetical protein